MKRQVLRTRQLAQHAPGCIGMKCVRQGTWNTPWYLTGDVVYRNKAGVDRGSSYRWLVARCNTVSSHPCPAELLIRDKDILDLVPHGTTTRPSQRTRP